MRAQPSARQERNPPRVRAPSLQRHTKAKGSVPAPAQLPAAPTHALLPPPLGSAGIPNSGQRRRQPRPPLQDPCVPHTHARGSSPLRPAGVLRARDFQANSGEQQSKERLRPTLSLWHVVCRQKAICLLIFGLHCIIFFLKGFRNYCRLVN